MVVPPTRCKHRSVSDMVEHPALVLGLLQILFSRGSMSMQGVVTISTTILPFKTAVKILDH